MVDLPKTPSLRLDGKRALITGGGRGLGLAAAAALAEAGAHVTLAARSKDEIEEAASAFRAQGASAATIVLDVRDLDAVNAAVNGAAAHHILINNAGMNRPQPFTEVTVENYDTIMELNMRSAFFVAQAFARRLIAAGEGGSIVNLSSQMGHVGGAGRTVYCASKHGIEGLTKAMAIDLAPHKIRVNTICPTYMETPMTVPYFKDPVFRASVISKIKIGRLGVPEDIMGAIIFLASEASALMTGSALMLDGGYTAD